MSQNVEIVSNFQRKKFALKVRRDGPQPSIFVRSFRSFTSGVAEAAQHTWHQEPEQRPAGGPPGVLSRCSWQQAAWRNAGGASLDLIHYTRRAKARVGRYSIPVYISPSLSARRAVWMRSRAAF